MSEGVAERVVLGATYVVLAANAVVSGCIEAFLVPQRLPHGIEGLSVAIALLGNFGLGMLGGIGTKRLAGVLVPGISWLVTVMVIASWAPGGDVILPGALPVDPGISKVSLGFAAAGLFGVTAASVLTFRFTTRADPPTSPV